MNETSWERKIAMVRSIAWLIGFRIWCEALYCGRREREDVLRKEDEHDNDNCSIFRKC